MSDDNVNFLKVVYFDEGSAVDYLDVYNGGLKEKMEVKSKTSKWNFWGAVTSEVSSGVLLKALAPLIDLSIGAKGEVGGSRISESAIKTTISNTVLSDFIENAEKDDGIKKTVKYTVSAYDDSISFMKMYSAYFSMMKVEDKNINISKVDETLEKSKGYYELLAKNKENDEIVLRFNIRAFKNNYNLVDLTKMNLDFYSVEVGSMKVGSLNAESELDFNRKNKNISSAELLNTDNENDDVKDSKKVPVFDVILSGVRSRG